MPSDIYCSTCGDCLLNAPGLVCSACRCSDPSDWIRIADYRAMRERAASTPLPEFEVRETYEEKRWREIRIAHGLATGEYV